MFWATWRSLSKADSLTDTAALWQVFLRQYIKRKWIAGIGMEIDFKKIILMGIFSSTFPLIFLSEWNNPFHRDKPNVMFRMIIITCTCKSCVLYTESLTLWQMRTHCFVKNWVWSTYSLQLHLSLITQLCTLYNAVRITFNFVVDNVFSLKD